VRRDRRWRRRLAGPAPCRTLFFPSRAQFSPGRRMEVRKEELAEGVRSP
jgi:hypothetical protein